MASLRPHPRPLCVPGPGKEGCTPGIPHPLASRWVGHWEKPVFTALSPMGALRPGGGGEQAPWFLGAAALAALQRCLHVMSAPDSGFVEAQVCGGREEGKQTAVAQWLHKLCAGTRCPGTPETCGSTTA